MNLEQSSLHCHWVRNYLSATDHSRYIKYQNGMARARISILDGFRALAILSVLLYHYFSRWTPPIHKVSLYPYKSAYNYFSNGYLGVHFFFMISGFVIFFTLDNTDRFSTFWKKRLIRLLPSIIVASLFTILVFRLFDHSYLFPASHSVQNLIPSITFISPSMLNNALGFSNLNFGYINGAYWSLWPEIQFYLLSSVIYYLNKEHFIRYFMTISLFLIGVNYAIENIGLSNKLDINLPRIFLSNYSKWVEDGFNLPQYLPFFCIGVLCYLFFKNHKLKTKTPNYIKSTFGILVLFIVYSGIDLNVRLFYLFMVSLFLVFIFSQKTLRLLENKTLVNIGQSSYFLYLIHESVGVLIIYSIGRYFLPLGFILPCILIATLILLSNLFTAKIDKKMSNWLKCKLIKS